MARSAVLVDASGPYGGATARLLAREGVGLALGGWDREALEELEAEIRASGGQALVVGTHLAKRHHPAHLVRAAEESFGGVDALIFFSGVYAPPLASGDVDAWERSVDANLKGFVYSLAAALPSLREGGGRVVYLSCEDAGDPILSASRAAVRVLLEATVREFSDEGLGASEVRPAGPGGARPEECARAVLRALVEPPGEGVSVFEAR